MSVNLNVGGNTQPLEQAVQAAVTRLQRRPIKITVDDKGATQPLGNMKRSADEFSKSMEAANARIIAFGASMAIINGVADAFKALARDAIQVEKALQDINVVMGLSTSNLDKFSSGLFRVAKETGAAFNIASEAATEYARQGLTMEETLKRTRDALILTRITGMDSAEAVKALTAAMNTYGNQIKDTTQLVSKFAAVDVQFAVSAEDFADAIARTGQAARSAGVDIDELIGLVTAAQQQTARGGKVIGNSFKTIFTRIGRTDTLNQLENLGIAVRDLEGNTLGATRILTDLANTFDKLTNAQQAQIAQTVGGVFQINILKAVLSDAAKQNGILANATQISSQATDDAIQKNEVLRQTAAALATETGLALKEVSAQIGEIMLAPGMEKVLNTVKSMAEGLSGLLGDGEKQGSGFAKSLLSGIGNILTGPGLVIITAVFGKLFYKAMVYARDSLKSLIGVTTEAQKQKAIQSSLISLIGRHADLNKELLRTDISKAQKQGTIVALIKSQVKEAAALNAITKSTASTLMSMGYTAGLQPRGRGGRRASGHIPNFAERGLAARGGYAAGNIRQMNMPGEGSVIYNSAETVKNFAGFKQPAIMPPKSSTAGKRYQTGFIGAHGFDPYAGGGFVPNFNKGSKNKKIFDASNFAAMLVLGGGDASTKGTHRPPSVYGIPSANLPRISFNVHQMSQSAVDRKSDTMAKTLKKSIYGPASQQAANWGNRLKVQSPVRRNTSKGIRSLLESAESGADGAVSSLAGIMFEAALHERFPTTAGSASAMQLIGTGTGKGAKYAVGGDFDVVRASSELRKLFGAKGAWAFGDYKLRNTKEQRVSFAKKIAAEMILRKHKDFVGHLPGGTGKEAGLVPGQGAPVFSTKGGASYDPNVTKDGRYTRRLGRFGRAVAGGYVPNFANPLSDAIGRERAAGVPVSQIRVGSHQALMGKGNPLGIGVTNTVDEPNGLRDVFGARGFVPNYSLNPLTGISSVFSNIKNSGFVKEMRKGSEAIRTYKDDLKQSEKEIEKYTKAQKIQQKAVDKYTKEVQKAAKGSAEETRAKRKLANAKKHEEAASRKLAAAQNRQASLGSAGTGMGGRLGRISGHLGRMGGGNAGMMMMMGAPMAAGFLQQGDAEQRGLGLGGGDLSYQAGGALTGAASGAMMATMVAPFFGPFAPLVIGVGGLIGGVKGLIGAVDENSKAVKERTKREAASTAGALGEAMNAPTLSRAWKRSGMDKMVEKYAEGNTQAMAAAKAARDKELKAAEKTYRDTVNATKHQWGGQYAKLGASIGKGMEEDRSEKKYRDTLGFERWRALKKVAGNLEAEEKFMAKSLTDRDEEGNLTHKERSFTKKQWEAELEKINPYDEKDQKAMELYFQAQLNQAEKNEIVLKDEERGAILRVNIGRAMLAAQQEARMAQLRIKDAYLDQKMVIDDQTKFLGGLMSEEQKARLKLTESLIKNAEARDLGEQAAKDSMRFGLLRDIQNAKDSGDLERRLKQMLFKDTAAPSRKTFNDLTIALQKKSAKEILVMLEKINSETSKDIIERRTVELQGQVSILEEQKTMADAQAESTARTNIFLGERKDTLREINREMDMYLNKIQHEADIRGIESAVRSARFDSGPARSMRETFLHQRESMEDRAQGHADSYRKSGASLIGPIADNMDLTKAQRLEVLRDPNKLKTFSAKRIKSLQKSFDRAGGREYLDKLREQTSLRAEVIKAGASEGGQRALAGSLEAFHHKNMKEDFLLEGIDHKLSRGGGRKLLGKEGLEKLKEAQKEALDRLRAMESMDLSIADAKEQQEDRVKKISGQLTRQLQVTNKQIEKEKILQEIREAEFKRRTGPGAFGEGFSDGMTEMTKDTDLIVFNLGKKMPMMLRDGLAEAMGAAINKAEDLGDVLRGVAMGFLQAIQQAMLQRAAGTLITGIGQTGIGQKLGFSRGGKVPAMISNGEYVMGKKAVNRYGGGFMHSLNAGGKIPGYAQGGSAIAANFGGAEGFDFGHQYQRRAMSGQFYASQNRLLQEDASSAKGIIDARRRAAEAKKAKKRALMQMLVSTALSAGISAGLSSMVQPDASAALNPQNLAQEHGISPHLPASVLEYRTETMANDPRAWTANQWERYKIQEQQAFGGFGFNLGGFVSGKSGIDQIPAMLSEGEYVIKASSVQNLGKPLLDRINAGKFASGGPVDSIMDQSQTSSAGGGNTNNINISVNIDKSGRRDEKQETGRNQADAAKDEDKNKELGDRIKFQVVQVIREEQRPGGLLDDS